MVAAWGSPRTIPFLVAQLYILSAAACAAGVRQPPAQPELVAPGVISTDARESPGTFSPDGRDFYFVRDLNSLDGATIHLSRIHDGEWSPPEVLAFSGVYGDRDPFISPDGRRMFFSSNRPAPGKTRPGYDLWMVGRGSDGEWRDPERLPEPINTNTDEIRPMVSSDGTLYFRSGRPGNFEAFDFYRSRWDGERYGPAENLGPLINQHSQAEGYVSPDERFMLLMIPDSVNWRVVHWAFSEQQRGVWSRPTLLGPVGGVGARNPSVSPDGFVYFSSRSSGSGDVYRVHIGALGLPGDVRRALQRRP